MDLDKSRINLYLSKKISFISCDDQKQGVQYIYRVRQRSVKAL